MDITLKNSDGSKEIVIEVETHTTALQEARNYVHKNLNEGVWDAYDQTRYLGCASLYSAFTLTNTLDIEEWESTEKPNDISIFSSFKKALKKKRELRKYTKTIDSTNHK